MASQIKRALDYLSGTKDAWNPTIARFPSINVEQLVDDLRLPEKAGKIREQEEAEGAISLYAEAVELINLDLRRRLTDAQGEFNEAEHLYDQRIRQASLGPEAEVRVVSAAEECTSDFDSQITEDHVPLSSAIEEATELNAEYRYFRDQNGLQRRAPSVVDPAEGRVGLLWIAVVVALETAANGLFFAEGSTAGLVGGVSEAFFLSVINISLASVLGLFTLRYIRHRRWFWKITAGLSGVALVAGILALNLLIAHYREAFAAAEGAAVRFDLVLQRLQFEPFSMQQPESWLLGALGVVFNMFATLKFFQLLDPYPGYTKLAVRRKEALERLSDEAARCLDNLARHRNQSVSQMERIIELIERNRSELEIASRGKTKLVTEFRDHLRGLEDAGKVLSTRLRTLSEIHRHVSDEALPKLTLPDAEALPSSNQASTELHERLAEKMKDAITGISDTYKAASGEIRQRLQAIGAQ